MTPDPMEALIAKWEAAGPECPTNIRDCAVALREALSLTLTADRRAREATTKEEDFTRTGEASTATDGAATAFTDMKG